MQAVRSGSKHICKGAAQTRKLTLSAVQGALEPALVYTTLPEFFQTEILEKYGDKPALIARREPAHSHGGPKSRNLGVETHLAWDFNEFDAHISALARGLLSMGVKKGERVAVVMGNTSSYALLQWACASIGAILVTVNPAFRTHELAATLRLVGVSHLFVVPRLRSTNYTSEIAKHFPGLANSHKGEIQEEALPDLRNIVVIHNARGFEKETEGIKPAVDWRELFVWRRDTHERKMHEELRRSLDKDDIANLQFTSGTTGAPKAVSLTHHNLLNNALSIGRSMRLEQKDVVCNVPPLFHCFGLVLGNLAAWTHGACIVYPSETYNPAAIVEAVVEDKCSALHGVPTHFIAEIERREKAGDKLDFGNLRTGIAAGSPVPNELMKRLGSKMNLAGLTNAYGMTETSPVSFQTTTDDPIIKRVETVGKVMPHVKARLVDPDGKTVPVGVPGELCVAGYLLQKGYWENPEHTATVMKTDKDGILWMHTGDEGIMDHEGYLKIVGRMKDIIIRGGENLFPVQIENAIGTHPGVQEVAVVAVPDEKFGEVVGAWVVRQPGTEPVTVEEIRKAVVDNMNPQNAPAWVWFVGEDGEAEQLPTTASGKVMKHILRDWSKERVKRDMGRTR